MDFVKSFNNVLDLSSTYFTCFNGYVELLFCRALTLSQNAITCFLESNRVYDSPLLSFGGCSVHLGVL